MSHVTSCPNHARHFFLLLLNYFGYNCVLLECCSRNKLIFFSTHYFYNEAMGRIGVASAKPGSGKVKGSEARHRKQAPAPGYCGPRREAVTAKGGTFSFLGERDPTSCRNERGPGFFRGGV